MTVEPTPQLPAVPTGERWIRESGVSRLSRTIRERWLIVLLAVLAAVLGALFYVSSATPVYQADAQLLISPVTDPSLNALSLIRSSSDPSNDTQTAALLVRTAEVAAEAARLLHSPEPAQSLLNRVQATPVAGSDVLAVTANASTPSGAARLANAFAQAAIDVRSRLLQAQLRTAIPRLQAQIKKSPQNATANAADSLVGELAALRALEGGPDPTIQLGSPASAPATPISPRRTLSLAVGALLGLVLGVATAFAADALDPRLRRESQLQGVLDLPVLARMPSLPNGGRLSAVDAHQVKSLLTAHEFLAEMVGGFEQAGGVQKRTIVFTSVRRDTGCTTIAIQHAWLVAGAGERVILMDGDPRDPAVGPATGARPAPQMEHALAGSRPIEDALVPVQAADVKLRVLAVHKTIGIRTGKLWSNRARDTVAELLQDADVLVVDAPPLTKSARALVLARSADCVVVVAWIGATRLEELRELGALLADHGMRGAGIVLVHGRAGSDSHGRHLAGPRAWSRAIKSSRAAVHSTLGKRRTRAKSRTAAPAHALPRSDLGRPRERSAPPGA